MSKKRLNENHLLLSNTVSTCSGLIKYISPHLASEQPATLLFNSDTGWGIFIMTKTCSKCKETKPVAEFNDTKRTKDGKQAHCRECTQQYYYDNKAAIKEKRKQYLEANKDAITERQRKYYQANKDAVLEQQKKRYQAKKEVIREVNRRYYQANKDAAADYNKEYRKQNWDNLLKYKKQYKKQRRETDPLYRLKDNTGSRIRCSFSKGGYSKISRTAEILGCSYEEYHQHIESQFTDGMSWERMSEIHIDHRLPVSAASTEAELLVLNHHRNLQPMWAEDNMAKSDSYCPKELAAYFAKYL